MFWLLQSYANILSLAGSFKMLIIFLLRLLLVLHLCRIGSKTALQSVTVQQVLLWPSPGCTVVLEVLPGMHHLVTLAALNVFLVSIWGCVFEVAVCERTLYTKQSVWNITFYYCPRDRNRLQENGSFSTLAAAFWSQNTTLQRKYIFKKGMWCLLSQQANLLWE